MAKQHYCLRLLPPRPTFISDMAEDEKALMQEHATYMRELFTAGKVLLYGPVMAAAGAFGLGVFAVDCEAEARQIIENDPTIRAGMNTFELSPMMVAGAQATQG